jgi:outer membrane immunogenic protein
MRNLLLGSAMSIAMVAGASAADMYVKAPPPAPTWTGWYVGANGGYGWDANVQKIDITTAPPLGGYPAITNGTDAKGAFGGGQIGYNWQGVWHPHLVIGIEADIEGSGIQNGFQNDVLNGFGDTLQASKNLDWFGTVRGRLGFTFGSALVYGTGGFAFGGVRNQLIDTLSVPPVGTVTMQTNSTATGYVVGAGIEYLISPHWSLKAEYQYINLGSFTLSSPEVPPSGFVFSTNKIDNAFNTVRVGINYQFGGGSVVTRY